MTMWFVHKGDSYHRTKYLVIKLCRINVHVLTVTLYMCTSWYHTLFVSCFIVSFVVAVVIMLWFSFVSRNTILLKFVVHIWNDRVLYWFDVIVNQVVNKSVCVVFQLKDDDATCSQFIRVRFDSRDPNMWRMYVFHHRPSNVVLQCQYNRGI